MSDECSCDRCRDKGPINATAEVNFGRLEPASQATASVPPAKNEAGNYKSSLHGSVLWAVNQLQHGLPIRRRRWVDGERKLVLDKPAAPFAHRWGDLIVVISPFTPPETWSPSIDDIMAQDWEIALSR